MAFLTGLLNFLLIFCSLFLICLVLIQRGRGGGLAGAFGGVGGSSAFGTKAGDVFTRITIVVACIWFLLSMLLVVLNNRPRQSAFQSAPASASEVPVPGGSAAGKGTPTDKGAEKGPGVPTPSPSATQPGPADTQQGKSSSGIPEVFPSESSSKSKSAPAPVKTP